MTKYLPPDKKAQTAEWKQGAVGPSALHEPARPCLFCASLAKKKELKVEAKYAQVPLLRLPAQFFPKNTERFKVPAQPGGFDPMIRGCLSPRFHLNAFAVTPNEPKLSGGPVAHSPTRTPRERTHLTLLVS